MMKRVLITGATGNVGNAVIHFLTLMYPDIQIIAAVRDIPVAKEQFNQHRKLQIRQFDFGDLNGCNSLFKDIDIVFLLRPPHISDIDKYFRPLLKEIKLSGVEKVVFLSVQGAEKSKMIPHNKIERLIRSLQFEYIFVRPGYFMQNLTTTLLSDIQKKGSIILPSGKAKFNWIDIQNIGEVTALFMINFDEYKNQAYEITGTESKNFDEVVLIINEITNASVCFRSINPFGFYFLKRRDGLKQDFALVMTILHFLPRLQKTPLLTNVYQKLTNKNPTLLKEFIEREKDYFF